MINKNADYYFLRGGGEMGGLIRAKDWSKTSLGEPADWPQSLRTMVAVMLDNPFGMYIAWGSDYTQLYNDGYRPILGATKHPQALGISTRETFSEIWHIIGPMFDDVMRGIAVGFPDLMLPLNRNGFVEECYFDFSYSPIRKDDGEVGGVLVTVIETTSKKKAEEALKESEQLFRDSVKQAPVAITILRGKDFIVEMANDAYLQLVDRKSTEFVGRPLFESLPEVKESVNDLLNGVLDTGTPFHGYEVAIPVNRYGKQEVFYFDFLYHPIKERDGAISGIIVTVTEVSEKVSARKKIEQNNKQLESIFSNAPAAIAVITGPDHIYVLANSEYQKMVNRTSEQLVGKTSREIFPELVGTGTFEIFDNIYKTGESFSLPEYPVKLDKKENGIVEQMYFRFSAVPLKDAEGKFNSIVIVSIDITEQVVAHQNIEKSEKKFQAAIEAVEGIIWTNNADGEMIGEQPGWAELTGQRFEEYQGYGWAKSVHPDDAQSTVDAWNRAVANRSTFESEHRVMAKSGDWKLFSVKAVPVFDERDIVLQWVGVHTDITEHRAAIQKIKESEERFRSLAQTLPQLVWITDAQGELEFGSVRWKEYTGIEPGAEKEWETIVHPDDYDSINSAWEQSLATGSFFTFEVRLLSKEGKYKWFGVKGEPVFDEGNKIVKWVGAYTDIHEQKIKEEKKDEFISIASHEMKTPLTIAKSNLQMLERTLDKSNAQAALHTKKAIQSVNRLNELIAELLDVSKIRLGKLNYTITDFDFNEMVDSTVENMQPTSPNHTIIKSGKIDGNVTGDKERLQQVIINLLTNAIKYSPGSDKVFIHLEQQNETLIVSVKDTGIGIAKQSLDKIFEKYHRVEEHSIHYQGLGIGLFISHEIIQRHNGKLWAESEPGKGSTIYFTLPVTNIPLT